MLPPRPSPPRPPAPLAPAQLGSAPLGPRVLGFVEPLWWVAVALAVVPGLGQPWSGAVTAVGALVVLELAGRARRPGWALAAPAAVAAAGALSMVAQPQSWLTVAVLGAASMWAIWRRMRPFEVDHARLVLDITAALLPAVTVLAVASATSAPVAVATASGLVLLATLPATRPLLDRGPDDTFWLRWWQVALAAVAAACALLWSAPQIGAAAPVLTSVDQWTVIGAIATLAVASAWGPVPRLARPWLLAGLGTWAWALTCTAATIPDAVRGTVPAALALLVVLAAHAPRPAPGARVAAAATSAEIWPGDAHRRREEGGGARGIDLAGSTGLAAHAVALVSIGLGGAAWGALATVGLATAGFAATTAFDAVRTSPVVDALGAVHPLLRPLPMILAALGIPLTTLEALDVAGVNAWTAAPTATVLAACALVYAVVTRLLTAPRLQVPLAWIAFGTGLGAAAAGRQGWPLVVGLAAVIAVVCLLPASRRAPTMVWVAWAAVAPLAAAMLTETWPAFAALVPQVRTSAALIGVGGAMLVAAAGVDLAFGPWVPRWRPRRAGLAPVAALGAVEVVAGGLLATASTTGVTLGWFLLAVAVVTLATATLALAGVLGGVGVVLAWAGAALLVGPDATVPTWLGVVCAGALIALSEVARRFAPDPCWWSRWDVPLLVAAAPVAVTTLATCGPGASGAAGTAAIGLEVIVVAVLWRHQSLVAALLGPLGTVLVLQGAATAGGYWLALALVGLSAGLTALAGRSTGAVRGVLQVGGALAAAAAWVEVLSTAPWPPQAELDVTVLGSAVVTVALAAVAWTHRIGRSWILAWSVTAAGVVGAASLLAHAHAVDAQPSAAVVLALALVAAAAFVAAVPLRLGWLRDVGVLWTTAAVLSGMTVWQAAPRTQVMVLGGASLALAVLLLLVGTRAGTWRGTIVELGLVSVLAAVVVAATSGDAALLAAALAVAAVQAAACGATLELLWVQAVSPMLACAAWLVFASESLPDDPQWWAMPIGVTLLAVVGLWRSDRGRRGLPLATSPIVAVELAGVSFLVGAWAVQAVVSSLAYTLPLLALGVLIAAWGVVTRVRRRVGEGATVVLAAVVLVVAVPLVHLLPSWGGAGLWILIAGIGVTAVLVASLLEQGRAAVRRSRERFAQVTADWE